MKDATIHRFERNLEQAKERIQHARLPKGNKRLMLEFDRLGAAEGLSMARRFKLLSHVWMLATKYLPKDFRKVARKDLMDAVFAIESSDLSPWTKHDYKVAIRKFFKFVQWGTEALHRKGEPRLIAGISTTVKKREQVRITAADILTTDEITRIQDAAPDIQMRALVMLMYELGARISEIGTMNVGSVSRDHYGFICDLNGKTGRRSPRVVLSAGALTNWLNAHPKKGSHDAPLWGFWQDGEWHRWRYDRLRWTIGQIARRAGIRKRVHPHLFRHSRITHVLASGQLNEAQVKKYFGLTADSAMIATYAHLVSKDSNDAILRMYGIAPADGASVMSPQRCGMCQQLNESTGAFCRHCGYTLSEEAIREVEDRASTAGQWMMQLFNRPGVLDAFRTMIREVVRHELAQSLPARSAQRTAPIPVLGSHDAGRVPPHQHDLTGHSKAAPEIDPMPIPDVRSFDRLHDTKVAPASP